MASRKSDVQVSLSSTSIAVLKELLHQVEQVKAKRARQAQAKDSTLTNNGQLPLISEADDEGDKD